MIFPYGLPDRERKKRKKICNYENCPYLCIVVWFKGSFTLLWLPFYKTKNRMFECFLSHTTIRTQGNIKHFCVVFPV